MVRVSTTNEEIQRVLKSIGINKEYEEYFVTEYNSETVKGLNNHLGEYESINNLNYLAGRIQKMTPGELEEFNAIMDNNIDVEQDGAVGCINLTGNLDKCNYYPGINDEEELGIFRVKEVNDFNPESAMGEFAMYFDYEAYGRDFSINDGGIFTDNGYLSQTGEEWELEYDGKRENIPDEYKLKKSPEVQNREEVKTLDEAVEEALEAAELQEAAFEMEM
ncbi:MAG: antirestriction protein ArdA [Bacteroidales bacterium]|nr:antirestriction protein ArdA [Clostridium sp.]MCM1204965.1 antirestriction protein ArdA [Bacteroidales bacterium]